VWVSRQGQDEDHERSEGSSGAPGGIRKDRLEGFSPPELELDVTDVGEDLVWYDFDEWTVDDRFDFGRLLVERNVEHVWHGSRLLVPERLEFTVDELLDGMPEVLEEWRREAAERGHLERLDLSSLTDEQRLVLDHRLSGNWPTFGEAWAGLIDFVSYNFDTPSNTPHAWDGTTLVVRSEDADSVGVQIAMIENASALALDPDADKLGYEVGDLDDEGLTALLETLTGEKIPHQLNDDGELIVHEADEAAVERILEAIDFPEHTNPEGESPMADGLEAQEVLSDLFEAADRLCHSPRNPEIMLEAVDAAERMEQLPVPFGFDRQQWKALVDRADALSELISGDDQDEGVRPDDATVIAAASELRDRLRPLV
jgi:hypothetical protein